MTENSPELSAEEKPESPFRRVWSIGGFVLLVMVLLLAGPLIAWFWLGNLTEPRLLGTWQSDADRTIAGMLGEPPYDVKREAKLRNLFGKMRITWARGNYTSDFQGTVETKEYVVLGVDRHSAVIREVSRKDASKPDLMGDLMEDLMVSSFQVIHFEGPDSYWLESQMGGMREYFKRVK